MSFQSIGILATLGIGLLGVVSPGAGCLVNFCRRRRPIGLTCDVKGAWVHLILTANHDDIFYVDVIEVAKGLEENGRRPTSPWLLRWREDAGNPKNPRWHGDRGTPRRLNLAEAKRDDPTSPGFFVLYSTAAPEGWKVWPEDGEVRMRLRARAVGNRRKEEIVVTMRMDDQGCPSVQCCRDSN